MVSAILDLGTSHPYLNPYICLQSYILVMSLPTSLPSTHETKPMPTQLHKQEFQRFQIDLGCDEDDLALHFNPRFNDDTDGTVLVCNSKIAGCWGDEKRVIHNLLQRSSTFKIVLKLMGDMFEVEMPDGQEI
ncbi:galectin-2-like [Salmo salar]|nr:galectin-2-like [Salmo salar]